MSTVPADAPPLKLKVPAYRVPIQCAAIDPDAAPLLQTSVSETSLASMPPSTVRTGVPGDQISCTTPLTSSKFWLANCSGAGYCAVAHTLTSICGETNCTDQIGRLGPLGPPLPADSSDIVEPSLK